jgi:hypothetical protein
MPPVEGAARFGKAGCVDGRGNVEAHPLASVAATAALAEPLLRSRPWSGRHCMG